MVKLPFFLKGGWGGESERDGEIDGETERHKDTKTDRGREKIRKTDKRGGERRLCGDDVCGESL